MRELKFRVWDTIAKEWATSLKLKPNGHLEDLNYDSEGFYRFEPDPDQYVIELCTGLKDKNGKEIYDGDIIHEKWYDSEAYRGKDRIGKVEYFCDGYFCWFRGEFTALGMFPPKHLEVVGNIHENSELLRDRERR